MERLLVDSNLVLSEPIEHPDNHLFDTVKIAGIKVIDRGNAQIKEFVLTTEDQSKEWNSAPAGPEELLRYEDELRKLKNQAG